MYEQRLSVSTAALHSAHRQPSVARCMRSASSFKWQRLIDRCYHPSVCVLVCALVCVCVCWCVSGPIFYRRKKVQKDLNEAQEALERFAF